MLNLGTFVSISVRALRDRMEVSMKHTSKAFITSAIFCAFVLFFAVALLLFPKKVFSEEENRALSVSPTFNTHALLNGEFASESEAWLNDHFPLRTNLISLKTLVEKASGRNEINGVCYLANGTLSQTLRSIDERKVLNSLSAADSLATRFDGNSLFALAPTAAGVYPDMLPSFSAYPGQDSFIDDCGARLKSIGFLSLYDALHAHRDEYIYYRTDHHWTTLGGYYAYRDLCGALSLTPLEKGLITERAVADGFRGSLYSKTLDPCIEPDSITARFASGSDIEMHYSNSVRSSVFFPGYLKKKDKYLYFLGANRSRSDIISAGASPEKRLLLIKDSYANCIVPLLAEHYSLITVIDLRTATPSELTKISLSDYSDLLFLFNAVTLTTDSLAMARYISN